MARYRVSRAPRRAPARPSLLAVVTAAILWLTVVGAMVTIIAFIAPLIYARYTAAPAQAQATAQPTTPAGAIGGQAPPSVRGSYADSIVATPIPGIAQNAAESQAMYQATAQAANHAQEGQQALISAPIAATPVPFVALPLNSAGDPVIDRTQQQQLDFSAQMAADEQQAVIRAAQLADAAARAPDVSYADAAAELHRDPCHVPRADPATCARGLFKPTPVQP
jgi:hypothetical protein